MKKEERAAERLVLESGIWYILLPILWIIVIGANLSSFDFIIRQADKDKDLLYSMHIVTAIFSSIVLTCRIDDFLAHDDEINTLPVSKCAAVKNFIDKTMLLYVLPYAVVIPAELFMAREQSAIKTILSMCLTIDALALMGTVFCKVLLIRRSENTDKANSTWWLIYCTALVFYGAENMLRDIIFITDTNAVAVVSCFISVGTAVLFFIKGRNTAIVNFE